jgi:hypothetical protein
MINFFINTLIGIVEHFVNCIGIALNVGGQLPQFFEPPYYPGAKPRASFLL